MKKNRAFSLLELILYVAIASLVVMSTTSFFFLILQSRIKNQTVADVEQEGQLAMQRMTQSIRNSTSIDTPLPASSSPTLSIATSDATKNPIVFDSSGNSLRITEATNPPMPLTSDKVIVNNLSFNNLTTATNSSSIRIQFTVSHINPGNKFEYDYSQTFYGTADTRY